MCYTEVAGLVQRKPAPYHTRRNFLMGRAAKPPQGFYTAGQAIKKLHMSRSNLYNLVEKGQIRKITPPNKTDGFYAKDDVDKIAKAQEAFILQYASDTSTFAVAQEEDIEGIADLNAELFGGTEHRDITSEWHNIIATPKSFTCSSKMG